MINIEIKTALDDVEATVAAATALGARAEWTHRQTDTFFTVAEGYLKLREVEGERSELIAYRRESGTEPRPSDYDIVRLTDGDGLRAALKRSLGVRGVVRKTRQLYLWRHTRIHIDQVEDLGDFLELETVVRDISLDEARAEAERVITALGLDRSRFLSRPYLEMLEARDACPPSPAGAE